MSKHHKFKGWRKEHKQKDKDKDHRHDGDDNDHGHHGHHWHHWNFWNHGGNKHGGGCGNNAGNGNTGGGNTGGGTGGGVVTPPPPPPPPPPAPVMALVVASVVNASTNDTTTGTDAADQLTGGAGNDTIFGGAGDDVITGDGQGRVTVALDIKATLSNVADASAYTVVVSGMPAGATLSAGTDNGDGTWTLSSSQVAGLTISSSDQGAFTLGVTATATGGSGATATSTLAVSLAAGSDDVLDGGDGNDVIDGGNGSDTLIDGAGNDLVYGGADNDTFRAGAGNDRYDGGDGFDTIDFSQAAGFGTGGVYVNLFDGIASDMGNGTGEDIIGGVEGVIGSVGGDLIFGNAVANKIDGKQGDDLLIGGAGADTLTGGEGNDIFIMQAEDFAVSASIDTITDLQVGDVVMLGGMTPTSLVDNGQSSTLYADVNGQMLAVVELQGISGLSLDDLYNQGMLA